MIVAVTQRDEVQPAGASDQTAALSRDGFAVVENVFDRETVNRLAEEIDRVKAEGSSVRGSGRPFGIRNLLNVSPSARTLAESEPLLSLVRPALGGRARVVRGVYFDKNGDANWKVAWHQDLTIAVRERVEVEGFGPWSVKAGVCHAQPPVSVLEGMIALRVHLDDADESNGALRIIPGSHARGRLSAADIQTLKGECRAVTCDVHAGAVLLMRPLLLHASSAAARPRRRRVLHFEYSASDLPGGLAWYEAPGEAPPRDPVSGTINPLK